MADTRFEHIVKNVREWPINKFHNKRAEFIEQLNEFVFNRVVNNPKYSIEDLISKTIYLEQQRVRHSKWKVDPADESKYWKTLNDDFSLAVNHHDKEGEIKSILKRIINRYNVEIVGNFKVKTFLFARKFLNFFFKRLFNRFNQNGHLFWGRKKDLVDKIKFGGYVDETRNLYNKGTLVVVPTHYSNLDSIIVGYCIDKVAKIPAFVYGAGLNLFNVEIAGYYMNRLGAYRVDRRKKNPIYLDCLVSMVSFSLYKGVNNIFFPGGTRSRSGSIESRLKLGLLGATIESQRLMLDEGRKDKIFIVPMTIGYHFTLEARALADQHIRGFAKEKFSTSKNPIKTFKGRWKFFKLLFSKESELYMTFGEPMDVMGNLVDADGKSLDKNGTIIKLEDYFLSNGELTKNQQRENVYTKILGDKIVESFLRNSVVLSSGLIAFVAFKILEKSHPNLDVQSILKLNTNETNINIDDFCKALDELLIVLRQMEKNSKIRLSPIVRDGIAQEILDDGLEFLGAYHIEKVLKYTNDKKVGTENLRLLYYYHNRMIGYDLEKKIERQLI